MSKSARKGPPDFAPLVIFLIKMLNHPQLPLKNIAGQSFNLDMENPKVVATDNDMNFLGFEINEEGYLNSNTKFRCQSDWPVLLRYARNLDISSEFRQGKAGVIIDGEFFDEDAPFQKLLFKLTVNREVNDLLEKSAIKARLSLLPANFTNHVWNSDNEPSCTLCH